MASHDSSEYRDMRSRLDSQRARSNDTSIASNRLKICSNCARTRSSLEPGRARLVAIPATESGCASWFPADGDHSLGEWRPAKAPGAAPTRRQPAHAASSSRLRTLRTRRRNQHLRQLLQQRSWYRGRDDLEAANRSLRSLARCVLRTSPDQFQCVNSPGHPNHGSIWGIRVRCTRMIDDRNRVRTLGLCFRSAPGWRGAS